ncbi:transposable element Tcb2 transposase [Trichonephila clavipes]|nr:transposable element Tcb2 transposase [Trichonephila clavipes]
MALYRSPLTVIIFEEGFHQPIKRTKQSFFLDVKDEVEKLAYQLNEEAERTERPIRRLSQKKQAGEIARHTTQATGRPISRFTVARRLHGGGLFARRPVRCVPLTPAHRRRRSLWCREHRNWRDNEWGRVLFTDERRFSLSSNSHRILIWRERGSRNHPSNIIERDRYGGRGVLVWGGIMLGSSTDLHIFDAGSVNGTRYCNEILLPYVCLFRGAMGLQFLFMDDNAPCHRTVAAEQLLESEDIERMDWPARYLGSQSHRACMGFFRQTLAARTLPPVAIRELRLALQDEWAAMPQQLIDTLILSMGRRCETCLEVSGEIISPTKDRMFLAGHPSQGCFGLQSHCAPCYFFNQVSFYPSDFSFSIFYKHKKVHFSLENYLVLQDILLTSMKLSCGTLRVVKIYRFWNSGAGGARRLRRMQTKEGGSPPSPGSEPGRCFVIDKGFGDLY